MQQIIPEKLKRNNQLDHLFQESEVIWHYNLKSKALKTSVKNSFFTSVFTKIGYFRFSHRVNEIGVIHRIDRGCLR